MLIHCEETHNRSFSVSASGPFSKVFGAISTFDTLPRANEDLYLLDRLDLIQLIKATQMALKELHKGFLITDHEEPSCELLFDQDEKPSRHQTLCIRYKHALSLLLDDAMMRKELDRTEQVLKELND